MLLDNRLEGVIEVQSELTHSTGRNYYEVSLISDDGQTLHLFEGQLKELPQPTLEVGRRYKIVFRPFLNNRWVELKIDRLEPA